MQIHFTGVAIAVTTFIVIGLFHPIVIKIEYYWGTKPWYIFLIVGLISTCIALFVENAFLSSLLGVFGASSLWSIGEIFEQRKRVMKGWFPKNPKRTHEYEN